MFWTGVTWTGTYACDPAGNWFWSSEVYDIFGFSTTDPLDGESLVAGMDEADRMEFLGVLNDCRLSGGVFGEHHRIKSRDGVGKVVIITGRRVGNAETGYGIEGFVIDVTEAHFRDVLAEADDKITRAVGSRAVIEQAKGALMLLYGIDDNTAFELLRWSSQRSNEKLNKTAERIVDAVRLGLGVGSSERSRLDGAVYEMTTNTLGRTIKSTRSNLLIEQDNASDADVVVLRITGWLDLSNAAQLSDEITLRMSNTESKRTVIDLRNIENLGPDAIRILSAVAKRARRDNKHLRVVTESEVHMLALAGDGNITVHASLNSAMSE